MPWVSLFDVYPDAVFVNDSEQPVPVVDGRVEYEFDDLGFGEERVYLYFPDSQAVNRVRIQDVVAIASEAGGAGLASEATLAGEVEGGEEVDEVYSDVDSAEVIEFELVPWLFLSVTAQVIAGT